MGRKGDKRLRQLVDDLVSVVASELAANLGVPDERGREIGGLVADRICFMYARAYLYVPAQLERRLTARDRDFWAAYCTDSPTARRNTAARLAEVSAALGITERQGYNIAALMRRLEADALQPSLTGFDAPAAK
ncbi:MAG: Mor transcription activator family protein [Aquabacterium sp.]